MDRFLRSNPGLASRFSTRVGFPSYTAQDLSQIAVLLAEQAGDAFEPEALHVLDEIFARAAESGRIDELGNGRFARSLFERACACRDMRVVRLGEAATAADLTTLTADDVRGAYTELAVQNSALLHGIAPCCHAIHSRAPRDQRKELAVSIAERVQTLLTDVRWPLG
jgi:hypothetical protein